MSSLGGVLIPSDLVWVDEFTWSSTSQVQQVSLGGALIIQESSQQAGRQMTLAGTEQTSWISRSALEQLQALADNPGQTHSLTFRGQLYTVVFDRRRGSPIQARPVIDYHDPGPDDPYFLEIRLQQV